jgi:hypothetical protein
MWIMKCMIIHLKNCSHPNGLKKRFKEKFGSRAKKKSNRFTTKDKHTCNVTHNTVSAAASKVKSDRLGITVNSSGEITGRKGLRQVT